MAYMDHIRACNDFSPRRFVPFFLSDGVQIGWVCRDNLSLLNDFGAVLVQKPGGVYLADHLKTPEERSAAMADVARDLQRRGVVSGWRDEPYAVCRRYGEEPHFVLERCATSFFGVRAFGVHMNGFVRSSEGLKMWVARRAADKAICPGMLDNMVAGGQPYPLSLHENLMKECAEEAAIPPEVSLKARSTGIVSYVMETDGGVKPDVMYCYDLELPETFQPRPADGEVDEFHLWPVEKVAEIVRETSEFKFNCNLVIIDFLIRHGIIQPENEPDYMDLVTGLRG